MVWPPPSARHPVREPAVQAQASEKHAHRAPARDRRHDRRSPANPRHRAQPCPQCIAVQHDMCLGRLRDTDPNDCVEDPAPVRLTTVIAFPADASRNAVRGADTSARSHRAASRRYALRSRVAARCFSHDCPCCPTRDSRHPGTDTQPPRPAGPCIDAQDASTPRRGSARHRKPALPVNEAMLSWANRTRRPSTRARSKRRMNSDRSRNSSGACTRKPRRWANAMGRLVAQDLRKARVRTAPELDDVVLDRPLVRQRVVEIEQAVVGTGH